MFIKIIQAKSNQGAKAQPISKDYQEILQNLNRGAFFERKKLTDKNLKQKLDWARYQGNLNCHDVTRELFKLINCPNLQRFPGYLTLKKMPLDKLTFSTWSINLKHHSVIKDLKIIFFRVYTRHIPFG
ncbi:MAG: hypothetical protein HC820_07570 [Hydrococcus sp. RM1_1_31]|nr:hypothetical protein [Hydrococcus sp. RM1_1_31]